MLREELETEKENFLRVGAEDFEKMSKEEREKILGEFHPELQGLLSELHTALKTVRTSLRPLLHQAKSRSLITREASQMLSGFSLILQSGGAAFRLREGKKKRREAPQKLSS